MVETENDFMYGFGMIVVSDPNIQTSSSRSCFGFGSNCALQWWKGTLPEYSLPPLPSYRSLEPLKGSEPLLSESTVLAVTRFSQFLLASLFHIF